MIPLAEINTIASKFHVAAEVIEKDYVICWILSCLAKSKIKDNFIFYGGTAIKRMYFENHRFSEDIDLLSYKHFTQDYLLQELDALHLAHDEVNLDLEINTQNIIHQKDRIQLKLSLRISRFCYNH